MTCAACGQPRGKGSARGLCHPCRGRAYRDGTIVDYPTTNWSSADLLGEFDFLRRHEGLTRAQVAERLNIKRDRLDKALERAAHPTTTRRNP